MIAGLTVIGSKAMVKRHNGTVQSTTLAPGCPERLSVKFDQAEFRCRNPFVDVTS